MLLGEADVVMSDAEALLASFAVERFYIARIGLSQAMDRRENTYGKVLGNSTDVSIGFFGDDDSLQAAGSLLPFRTSSTEKPRSLTSSSNGMPSLC